MGWVAQRQVDCTNCSTDLGLIVAGIGIVLAGAALVVSFWSLYVSALRRPTIGLRRIEHPDELRFLSWRAAIPSSPTLFLWIAVTNTGTSDTVVDQFGLTPTITGDHVGLWERAEAIGSQLRSTSGAGTALPIVFERGDAEVYWLDAQLRWKDEDMILRGDKAAAELAQQLRQIDSITLTVEARYERRKRFRFRARELVTEELQVEVDLWVLKNTAIAHWRSFQDYGEFADVLEEKTQG